ncbi:MAG: hypothetical protein DRH43_11590 [Deltaproteobacteria bacterium]|nr:MAG: hypothetical protein DRH43_11590 [Deltaproteobacteria bacterium]
MAESAEKMGQAGMDVLQADSEGKYLTFVLDEEEYGISILKVKEIIGMMPITAVPRTPVFVKGVINLRGKVIPVVDLRLKFGMEEIDYTERTCIIVVEIAGESSHVLTGLVVDAVSEEQAQGIEQINTAVSQLDQVTQQNAANAEESAAASEQLNAQAGEMGSVVHQLVAIVKGSGNHVGNGHRQVSSTQYAAGRGKEITGTGVAANLHSNGKNGALSSLSQNHQGENAAVAHAAATRQREAKPDEVIPLDDGGFKDF